MQQFVFLIASTHLLLPLSHTHSHTHTLTHSHTLTHTHTHTHPFTKGGEVRCRGAGKGKQRDHIEARCERRCVCD